MICFLENLFFQHGYLESVCQSVILKSSLAAITALLMTLMLGKKTIDFLAKFQLKQSVRLEGPVSHLQKSGTPTMGGILILLVVAISTLLWSDLSNYLILACLVMTLAFGFIGFYDDFLKIKFKNSKGISAKLKFGSQSCLSLLAVIILSHFYKGSEFFSIHIPFLSNFTVEVGHFYLIWALLVIVGSSNALNLTDGLDGLAVSQVVIIASALCFLCYLSGDHILSYIYNVPYVATSQELCVFMSAIVGTCLGFAWFNSYPAKIFMGDVGSLALGAALGFVALMIKQELLFMIMCLILVAETLSVIIQVVSFKLRKKRVFLMAPLHHHYELKGWSETKVVRIFFGVTLLAVTLCIITTIII